MARSANSQNIRRDQEGPDYAGVVGLVRGQLRSNDAEQRSLAQDNATIFKRVEKEHGVHKGAAKTFAQIDNMAAEKRTDYLRSLLGLLGVAGYTDFNDLVDRMQNPGGKPGAAKPKKDETPAPKAQAPDALDLDDDSLVERTDLKTGMIVSAEGKDVREATPEELAAERERQADFTDDKGGNVHPFPAGAKN